MTRRHIDIPDNLWRLVAIKAAEEEKTKREIVIEAIKKYLNIK